MSSGGNRDDCPECGYRKPGHKVRCRFGAALAEGRSQAERELMSPQMRALRGVVAEQVYQPVVQTGQGFADMVDRITRAVAEHIGQPRVDLSGDLDDLTPEQITELSRIGSGTVDGIRPHRPVTPEQYARMKWAAEQWEKDNPVTPERAAAMLAGRQNPTSCIRCGQPWIDATVRHLPDCPELDREAEHWSATPEMEEAAREGWESHGPQGAAVASGCPGCGAVPTRTRQGRSILHAATCPRAASRVPGPPTASGPLRTPGRYGECPQTERHTAHQWTGGVGDEIRYWCDGEPPADGS